MMQQNRYQRVLIMGAGGVGGYFGARIAQRTEAKVTFVARGAHLEAMQKDGIKLKSIDGDATIAVDAIEDTGDVPAQDLILFTVKSYSTAEAIKKIRPVVGRETQVLTIQNGIENYPKLVEAFGEDHVIQGFCKIGAGIAESGVINHKAFGKITIGEKNGSISTRVQKVEALCEDAEIPLHITKKIDREVWLKFSWNAVLNMITALANVTVEKLFEHEESTALCYQLFSEIQKVAQAEGVTLNDDDGKKIMEQGKELKGFTTSTYQDRQKGKKMEYEAFTGAIVRLAEKHGIAAPHNRTLYALLKIIDEKEV